MLHRRTLLAGTSALTSGLAMMGLSQKASAKTSKSQNVDPRGSVGRLERLQSLDLESKHDFMTGVMLFANTELAQASRARSLQIIDKAGLDLNANISVEDARKLFDGDLLMGIRDRVWHTSHNYEHALLNEAYHAEADKYLAEMEAYDKIGPGKLELNPNLAIPEYTRHEIHQQPGGYVGNPFAGHIYHYATNQFYRGANDQDERHYRYAASCPAPTDGSIKRILDLGTGIGQLAVTMKEKYPKAEVHGIDVAAPMLRYAHMRAVDLGSDITFSQRLAEKTGYPDNYFDIVISYIMFHEVTSEASKQIYSEMHRILRPGGVFYRIDFNQKFPNSITTTYAVWKDHRWNNERWRLEYASLDAADELAKAGFNTNDLSEPSGGFGYIIATKPT